MTKLSEITDKLDELEKRVAGIKDWKQKYEAAKVQWESDRKELVQSAEVSNKFKEAMTQFLALASAAGPGQPSKATINLKEKELVINLTHEEKPVNMTTDTVVGKILFAASSELPKDGFSEGALSESLKERGWNVGHSTLAPTLGGLVKDGYLIRLEGTRPARYRLPGKQKLNLTGGNHG